MDVMPRKLANLDLDLSVIADAFVVTVVGGLGSLPGAFLAAVLIGIAKALCIGLGFSKLTLVVEFVIMGVVLVLRPYGLLGKPPAMARAVGEAPPPLSPPRCCRCRPPMAGSRWCSCGWRGRSCTPSCAGWA